ncbi:MAG TPA: sigma-70 family RNA polymerase sigma factor [Sedimentisphaerales bacterium]|nr:sigma-70 family RNA polymerase sigma factor [Sedimentisphaerales bacterium]HRS09891.1 sigma-70 family RNA polymerase sigma factor [Sedimentisphaerales bacterium]HRV46459.1 sigma-70 family RNA polymerase sigma factor [Sedimentisphaerales bacterium]
MVEEGLLIFRFKRGSPQALRQIYDKYKVEMLKLATVLLGDRNTAEDIVHDVFVAFAGSAERIRLTGSLRSYLTTSVVNRVRNHRRNNHRHGGISLEDAPLPASAGPEPAQWAILDEQLTLLSRALQGLPYEQREVISLRMEMDMPFRRIATLQSASVNTVKGRYRYGIERLRSLLNGKVEHEIRR